MECQKLLTFVRPMDKEIAQRWEKISFNSCYGRISTKQDFKLYEVKK